MVVVGFVAAAEINLMMRTFNPEVLTPFGHARIVFVML
jgi:hypothetical protein